MQVEINISSNELLRIVKILSVVQQKKLKSEIEKETHIGNSSIELEALLLNGPVATKEELERIANNRKDINQCRRK